MLVAFVAGCGGAAPAPGPGGTPLPKVPAPACIAPSDDVVAITHAGASGTRVHYCVGASLDQCFAMDVATGAFMRLREPPVVTAPPTARVETTNAELKVCQGERCTTLTSKVLPSASSIRGATNADGSAAVFLFGDAEAGKGYAEVWDVTRPRKLATFRYARGDYRCGDVAILGNTVYVAASSCDAPAARGALYSLRGKRIAHVGGRDFGVYGNAYVQVEGSTWAFLEESGGKLAIQDVAKGKVRKTVDTSALFAERGTEIGNPGESALVRLDAGTLAVISGSPAPGNVATVDVATGEVKLFKATRCGG